MGGGGYRPVHLTIEYSLYRSHGVSEGADSYLLSFFNKGTNHRLSKAGLSNIVIIIIQAL